MERIGDTYYELVEGVKCPRLCLTPSSRTKTWITHEQIALEYPEAINMMAFVLAQKEYPDRAKDFVRSLLFFLETDQHLSWKQFDSIFFLFNSFDEYKSATKNGTTIRKSGNLIAAKRGGMSYVGRVTFIPATASEYLSTDRGFDNLHRRIFGSEPVFPERFDDDGEPCMSLNYRDDGSRYFTMPTEESLLRDGIEAFMSDIDRLAVARFFNKDLR